MNKKGAVRMSQVGTFKNKVDVDRWSREEGVKGAALSGFSNWMDGGSIHLLRNSRRSKFRGKTVCSVLNLLNFRGL